MAYLDRLLTVLSLQGFSQMLHHPTRGGMEKSANRKFGGPTKR
ncbi:MAG: hypothetical protein OJF51_000153 [Nitrospira sp.]|nr:MAG: hypothetical protein OJF51_000153 [Nitrospira sp.]